MSTTHDPEAAFAVTRNPNMMVPWYLMAGYAYYEEDAPILSDSFYDKLCVDMLARWDSIVHRHKHLIDPEALRAGTGFQVKAYPGLVKGAVGHLRATENRGKKHR